MALFHAGDVHDRQHAPCVTWLRSLYCATWRDGQDSENLWREKLKRRRAHSAVVFCLEMERRGQTFCVGVLFYSVGDLMWGFCLAMRVSAEICDRVWETSQMLGLSIEGAEEAITQMAESILVE